jgi:hypothetical protein
MILGCMAVLRESGMEKAEAVQHYERLLKHHDLTPDQVNAALPSIVLHGGLPGMDEARAHLLEIIPDLEGRI